MTYRNITIKTVLSLYFQIAKQDTISSVIRIENLDEIRLNSVLLVIGKEKIGQPLKGREEREKLFGHEMAMSVQRKYQVVNSFNNNNKMPIGPL